MKLTKNTNPRAASRLFISFLIFHISTFRSAAVVSTSAIANAAAVADYWTSAPTYKPTFNEPVTVNHTHNLTRTSPGTPPN